MVVVAVARIDDVVAAGGPRDVGVTVVHVAGKGGQQCAAPGRPDDDHVAHRPHIRRGDTQFIQHAQPARADEVTARLLARELAAIDQCDPRAGSGQAQRGRASGRARAYDDGVETRHGKPPPDKRGETDMRSVERSRTEPNQFARDLFDGLPSRYDLLAEVLSFGQNRRWRTAMVDVVAAMAPPARRVLDVATGTAGVAVMLTERTGADVTGLDLTEPMLRRGQDRIARHGKADRIGLVAGRAEQLPFADNAFDALTFTYLMRYVADPQATIRELARVVRPGGWVASLEFAVPPRRLWHAGWRADAESARLVIGFSLPTREAVDERYAALTSVGYAGRQPPFDAFWGARYAIVADPDGNDVGLMSPLDESRRTWPPEESPASATAPVRAAAHRNAVTASSICAG